MCWEIASIALSAGASALSAANSISQGNAQAAMLKRQAKVDSQQGEIQAGDVVDKANQSTGQAIASAGGSGVTLQGSPTDVIASTASDAALDTDNIRWGARVNAQDKEYQAKVAKIAAKNEAIGTIIGGASQLASGLARVGNPFQTTAAKKQDRMSTS